MSRVAETAETSETAETAKTCGVCQERSRTPVCQQCLGRIRRDVHTIVKARAFLAEGPITTTGMGTGNDRPLPGGVEWIEWQVGAELRAALNVYKALWRVQDPNLPNPRDQRITGLLAWFLAHLDHVGQHTDSIDGFAKTIGTWATTARRLTGDTPPGQIVRCPGLSEPCGRRLRIDVHQPADVVPCRQCGTQWTSARLIADAFQGSTEAWADADAIHAVTGIPARTLRRWAQAGRIQRRNSRYLISEVYAAWTSQ